MWFRVLAALLAITVANEGAYAGPPDEAAPPEVRVTLTPVSVDGNIAYINVTQTLRHVEGSPDRPLVSVPARVALTMGQSYAETDVLFHDAAGSLPVAMKVDEAPSGVPLQMRSFTPRRPTRGAITISYSARVAPALAPRAPGPSYDLRGAEGGAGGAYFSFLLLPLQAPAINLELAWNLDELPEGARAISTRGRADIVGQVAPMEVYSTFFLVGRVNGNGDTTSAFRANWIGTPPFDAEAASAWSGRTYSVLRDFFREPEGGAYTFLMRPYARPRDGGGASRGGFMLEFGTGTMSDSARRIMFTHEMIHNFVGGLEGDSSSVAWFGEGLAEYYKLRLLLRHRLIHVIDAERELGVMTNAYYTSPATTLPYAHAAERRWSGGAAQLVPYNRGFMYFANLDAMIRERSEGRRSLDDLVLTMLERRRSGGTYDEDGWRELLRNELASQGEVDLDNMLGGVLIVPPDDAFGDCFMRRELRVSRLELGMSEDSFLVTPYRITGLEPGSPAAASGLREGDAILSFEGVTPRVAHSASNVRLDPQVAVVVERGGEPLLFTFSTEGPTITEYTWTLRPGPLEGCAF